MSLHLGRSVLFLLLPALAAGAQRPAPRALPLAVDPRARVPLFDDPGCRPRGVG